jgi:RND family efflux transporter MFP subunit
MKKLNFVFLLGLVLVFTSCAEKTKEEELAKYKTEVTELQAKIEALEEELSDGKEEEKVLKEVKVLTLQKADFQHFIEVQGNVTSNQNVMINPELGGTITSMLVKEGQRVSAGQTIATVDGSIVKQQIQEIKKRLELATQIFDRQANLWSQKIGSEVQYLQAKNNKEALEENLKTVQTQLNKTAITAPISGVIDEVFSNKGESASPTQPVARIVNLSQVKVEAQVSESYLKFIKKGDIVSLKFPALGIERDAKISFVGQSIDERNRTFKIQLNLNNKDFLLKPNLLAMLKIKDFEQKEGIAIPSNLIQRASNGDKFLFTVNDKNIVKKVMIEPSVSYEGKALINKGLANNDRVIIEGYNEVIDGQNVLVAKGK